MIKVGEKAPVFRAKTEEGEDVELSDFRGKTVILYFYPRDMTPGCTKEACDFRDSHDAIVSKESVVIGVSSDGPQSHAKFREKYDLPFLLVADEDHSIARSYGVWQEKTLYGKKSMGTVRTTYVIDKRGVVTHRFDKVKVDGHVTKVLEALP